MIVGLASAAGLLAYATPSRTPRYIPAEHPAAVLAWANMRCDTRLALRPDAARAHPEDVIEVSAAYEAALLYQSRAALCQDAMEIAQNVMAALPPGPGQPAQPTDVPGPVASR